MPQSALRAGLVLLVAIFAAAESHAAETQTVHRFDSAAHAGGYQYLLALPADYDAHGARDWPLILFLHGSGERGDNAWEVTKHGPPKLLLAGVRGAAGRQLAENFIVLSPQCPKYRWWNSGTLIALLDEVTARHNVDPRRVYVTGLSMGGSAAWDLVTGFPERFAAAVPICGGGRSAFLHLAGARKRHDLRLLPVWAFHGAKDNIVSPAKSQRMVAALKKFRSEDVTLTIYPDAKHDSWTETYANPELYAWLLRHERPAPKPEK
jgi:predicted peptidase